MAVCFCRVSSLLLNPYKPLVDRALSVYQHVQAALTQERRPRQLH